MSLSVHRVEVTPRSGDGMVDVRGELIKRSLLNDHNIRVEEVRSILGFLVKADIAADSVKDVVDILFADPIIEIGVCNDEILSDATLFPNRPDAVISIGFKPGVTDNPGTAALDGLKTLHSDIDVHSAVSTTVTYAFHGLDDSIDIEWLAKQLHNP